MAKKNLSDRVTNQLKSLQMAANVSSAFQNEITEETKLEDLSADEAKNVVELNDSQLLDDPFNIEIFGDEDDKYLVEAMKRYGFLGMILAYPVDGGKYMIESGHRRREAARKAGLFKYNVYITEPPKNLRDRKLRLILHNLHGRKERISTNARIASVLFETHTEEINEKKEQGEIVKGDIVNVNELVAMDMGVSKATVERYRAFGRLTPSLQAIGDAGEISWSELATASVLDQDRQEKLADEILEKGRTSGFDFVTRPWLRDRIKFLKAEMAADALGAASGFNNDSKPSSPQVRTYGAKAVLKGSDALVSMLTSKTAFKETEVAAVTASLKHLRDLIDEAVSKLEKDK